MRAPSKVLAAVGLAGLVAAAGYAQLEGQPKQVQPQPAQGGKLNFDAQVLVKFHHINQAEMKVGKLATQQGSSKAVRDFGEQLYQDHMMADQKLQAIAKQQSIPVGETGPVDQEDQMNMKEQKAVLAKLQSLKGAEFDRTFAESMVKGHEKAIAMAKQSLAKLQNPAVKMYVTEVLPSLMEHREHAAQLAKSVKSGE